MACFISNLADRSVLIRDSNPEWDVGIASDVPAVTFYQFISVAFPLKLNNKADTTPFC